MRIKNILQYLEATALRFPEKIAFSDGADGQSLTFSALLDAVRRTGSGLLARCARGARIAVLMDRHPATIAAMLGVIAAGGCYVVLDAGMPVARMMDIVARAGVSLVIADEKNAPLAKSLEIDTVLYSALLCSQVDEDALAAVRARQIDTDPIYMVFTSGSTGRPKGVVACHRSVIDYAQALLPAIGVTQDSVLGCQSPLFFDAPLKEILSTLVQGATTYLIPRVAFSFPMQLLTYLGENKINTVCWVSSAFVQISALGALEKYPPLSLHTVVFGSEVFPRAHYDRWRAALPDAAFYQLYGPTEATGMSCVWRADRALDAKERIPIGAPMDNTDLILLSEDGRRIEPVAGQQSEPGEIYLRGSCVTLGYDGAPKETEAAFVQNPLHSAYPETVYRSGDMACYNAHGELVFLGRRDAQIKIQGHRIEPGEIEGAALRLTGITQACCVYVAEVHELVLFYAGEASEEALRATLREQLPPYMLPRRLIKKAWLATTANGKIDRRVLLLQAMELLLKKEMT